MKPPPARLRLSRLEENGFRLEGRGWRVEAVAAGTGRTVRGPGAGEGWRLEPESRGFGCGFLLRAGHGDDGCEIARSTRAAGLEGEPARVTLLAEDGRRFRLTLRIDAGGVRWELLGWETSGAYFLARPARGIWRLERTVAGKALAEFTGILTVAAAEILDAETLRKR